MNNLPEDKPFLWGLLVFLFFLSACVLLFYHLGCKSLWGSEGRWAEVVREMLLNHDFFHPRINGEPYFDKPLFTYWIIVLFVPVFGKINEFTVRFPSALSGLWAIGATFYLGQQLWNRTVGIFAGLFLLTSLGFVFWARTAAADMENMAFALLAVCWYIRFRKQKNFPAYLGFYLICFLGAQFKGLTAVAVPAVVVLCDVAVEKTWKEHLNISNLLALGAGAAFYAAPFIYSRATSLHYGEKGLYMAFRENILRFFMAFDHREPFYVYFYYLPYLTVPWFFLLAGYIVDRITAYSSMEKSDRWLLLSMAAIFLLFTASSSRRSYYILPILPFTALAMATFVTRPLHQGIWRPSLIVQNMVLLCISATATFNSFLWPVVKRYSGYVPPPNLTISIASSGSAALILLLISLFLILKQRGKSSVPVLMIGATYMMFAGFFLQQECILERDRPLKPFIMELRPMIKRVPTKSIALSKNMASVVFYMDRKGSLVNLEKHKNISAFLKKNGKKILITRRKDMKRLERHLRGCRMELLLKSNSPPWDKRAGKRLDALVIEGTCVKR